MVAQQADLALHDQVDALARIRPIADDVAKTIDLVDPLPADIRQDGLERFEVAMDIADECSLHIELTRRHRPGESQHAHFDGPRRRTPAKARAITRHRRNQRARPARLSVGNIRTLTTIQ